MSTPLDNATSPSSSLGYERSAGVGASNSKWIPGDCTVTPPTCETPSLVRLRNKSAPAQHGLKRSQANGRSSSVIRDLTVSRSSNNGSSGCGRDDLRPRRTHAREQPPNLLLQGGASDAHRLCDELTATGHKSSDEYMSNTERSNALTATRGAGTSRCSEDSNNSTPNMCHTEIARCSIRCDRVNQPFADYFAAPHALKLDNTFGTVMDTHSEPIHASRRPSNASVSSKASAGLTLLERRQRERDMTSMSQMSTLSMDALCENENLCEMTESSAGSVPQPIFRGWYTMLHASRPKRWSRTSHRVQHVPAHAAYCFHSHENGGDRAVERQANDLLPGESTSGEGSSTTQLAGGSVTSLSHSRETGNLCSAVAPVSADDELKTKPNHAKIKHSENDTSHKTHSNDRATRTSATSAWYLPDSTQQIDTLHTHDTTKHKSDATYDGELCTRSTPRLTKRHRRSRELSLSIHNDAVTAFSAIKASAASATRKSDAAAHTKKRTHRTTDRRDSRGKVQHQQKLSYCVAKVRPRSTALFSSSLSFTSPVFTPHHRSSTRVLLPQSPRCTVKPVRLVSYNILADQFISSDNYPDCPPAILAESYRVQLIQAELAHVAADVVVLQEMSGDLFAAANSLGDFVRDTLNMSGEHVIVTDRHGQTRYRASEGSRRVLPPPSSAAVPAAVSPTALLLRYVPSSPSIPPPPHSLPRRRRIATHVPHSASTRDVCTVSTAVHTENGSCALPSQDAPTALHLIRGHEQKSPNNVRSRSFPARALAVHTRSTIGDTHMQDGDTDAVLARASDHSMRGEYEEEERDKDEYTDCQTAPPPPPPRRRTRTQTYHTPIQSVRGHAENAELGHTHSRTHPSPNPRGLSSPHSVTATASPIASLGSGLLDGTQECDSGGELCDRVPCSMAVPPRMCGSYAARFERRHVPVALSLPDGAREDGRTVTADEMHNNIDNSTIRNSKAVPSQCDYGDALNESIDVHDEVNSQCDENVNASNIRNINSYNIMSKDTDGTCVPGLPPAIPVSTSPQRQRTELDGVAIFYKRDRFDLLESVRVRFNQLAECDNQLTDYERKRLQVDSHNVALLCVLRDRSAPWQVYIIATVHLIWNNTHAQLWQCHHLQRAMKRLKSKYAGMTVMRGSGLAGEEADVCVDSNLSSYQDPSMVAEEQQDSTSHTLTEKSLRRRDSAECGASSGQPNLPLHYHERGYCVTCVIAGDMNSESSSAALQYLCTGEVPDTATVMEYWLRGSDTHTTDDGDGPSGAVGGTTSFQQQQQQLHRVHSPCRTADGGNVDSKSTVCAADVCAHAQSCQALSHAGAVCDKDAASGIKVEATQAAIHSEQHCSDENACPINEHAVQVYPRNIDDGARNNHDHGDTDSKSATRSCGSADNNNRNKDDDHSSHRSRRGSSDNNTNDRGSDESCVGARGMSHSVHSEDVSVSVLSTTVLGKPATIQGPLHRPRTNALAQSMSPFGAAAIADAAAAAAALADGYTSASSRGGSVCSSPAHARLAKNRTVAVPSPDSAGSRDLYSDRHCDDKKERTDDPKCSYRGSNGAAVRRHDSRSACNSSHSWEGWVTRQSEDEEQAKPLPQTWPVHLMRDHSHSSTSSGCDNSTTRSDTAVIAADTVCYALDDACSSSSSSTTSDHGYARMTQLSEGRALTCHARPPPLQASVLVRNAATPREMGPNHALYDACVAGECEHEKEETHDDAEVKRMPMSFMTAGRLRRTGVRHYPRTGTPDDKSNPKNRMNMVCSDGEAEESSYTREYTRDYCSSAPLTACQAKSLRNKEHRKESYRLDDAAVCACSTAMAADSLPGSGWTLVQPQVSPPRMEHTRGGGGDSSSHHPLPRRWQRDGSTLLNSMHRVSKWSTPIPTRCNAEMARVSDTRRGRRQSGVAETSETATATTEVGEVHNHLDEQKTSKAVRVQTSRSGLARFAHALRYVNVYTEYCRLYPTRVSAVNPSTNLEGKVLDHILIEANAAECTTVMHLGKRVRMPSHTIPSDHYMIGCTFAPLPLRH